MRGKEIKMKKAIKIENINIDFLANNNDGDVHFEGSVTITWKTRKVLTGILKHSNNVTSNFLDDNNEIDFPKFEMMDKFRFSADVPLPENDSNAWNGPKFLSGLTAMCRHNGWSVTEITKLKKLGIIDWINAGENGCGDWDTGRIVFHENCHDRILLFKDVVTESQLHDEKAKLIEDCVANFNDTINKIKALGIHKSKSFDPLAHLSSDVEDIIISEVRDAISADSDRNRENRRADRKKKAEIKSLKSKLRALEGAN